MDKNLTALKQDAPRDARQVRSRKALNQALLELLCEKPFEDLTIREISARAGTGYATFFRHFPTKEALLSDLATDEIDSLLQRAIPLLRTAQGSDATRDLCTFIFEKRDLWSALLTGGAAGIVRNEFLRQTRTRADTSALIGEWLPEDLALIHGTNAIIGIFGWWLRHDAQLPVEQVATILQRVVIAPINGEPLPIALA